jgi:hypothetical protein
MSRLHGVCPALEDLLLAEEGELPPERQASVSAHLTKCATCQSTLHAIGRIMRMVGHVTKPFGENEPGSGDGAEARVQRFLVRLHNYKQQRIFRKAAGSSRRWLAIAAIIPILIGTLSFFGPTATVIEADELVKYATSAELARPDGTMQHVVIKLTPSNIFAMSGVGVPTYMTERDLNDGVAISTTPTPLEGRPATIAKLLADHNFHWLQPLSAVDFTAWRNTLAHKHDTVTEYRGSSLIVLRTTTDDDGELHEVELTIERESYRVKRAKFVFETQGTLEIEQQKEWVRHTAPAATPAPDTTVAVTRPSRPAPVRVDPLSTEPAKPQPDLANWLEQRLDANARAQFMPELRRLTGTISHRLDTLEDLSSRYPGSDGPQASFSGQARRQRELNLQYESLRNDLDALYKSMQTLTLGSQRTMRLPMKGSLRAGAAPTDWSRRVETARQQAIALDRLAGQLREYDDLPAPIQQQLAEAFEGLWSAIYAQ